MAEKTINTRIKLKIDTLTNWNSSTVKLKYGEVAFATTQVDGADVIVMKVGDNSTGGKTFAQLPDAFYAKASDVLAACKSEAALAAFINSHLSTGDGISLSFANNTVTITHAVPTDASAGAKGSTEARTYLKTITTDKFGHITGVTTGQEFVTDHNTKIKTGEVTFGQDAIVDFIAGNNITLTPDSAKATLTVTGKDWSQEIKSAVAGLSGAMHFKGSFETLPATTDYVAGDVVIVGKKEYVLVDNDGIKSWNELGDEGSYVLKTTKINDHDFTSGDITLSAADVGAEATGTAKNLINLLSAKEEGGAGKYIATIKQTAGKIIATSASMPTALKNPNGLTLGSKTYDGSEAVTVTATDLGALTAIDTTKDGGLKITGNKIDIDDTVTFVLDCGGAN